MSKYKVGQLLYCKNDAKTPSPLRVEYVQPVGEPGFMGTTKVGFRYTVSAPTGELLTYPEGDLIDTGGPPVTIVHLNPATTSTTTRGLNTSTTTYPQKPSLSQMRGFGTPQARVLPMALKNSTRMQAPSQRLLAQMFSPSPSVSSGSPEQQGPPKTSWFSFRNPSAQNGTPPQFKTGTLFTRALELKERLNVPLGLRMGDPVGPDPEDLEEEGTEALEEISQEDLSEIVLLEQQYQGEAAIQPDILPGINPDDKVPNGLVGGQDEQPLCGPTGLVSQDGQLLATEPNLYDNCQDSPTSCFSFQGLEQNLVKVDKETTIHESQDKEQEQEQGRSKEHGLENEADEADKEEVTAKKVDTADPVSHQQAAKKVPATAEPGSPQQHLLPKPNVKKQTQERPKKKLGPGHTDNPFQEARTIQEQASHGKNRVRTDPKYLDAIEWFEEYVKRKEVYKWEDLLSGDIPEEEVDEYILSPYISQLWNKTYYNKTGLYKRLDTTTYTTQVCRLCTMIGLYTPYKTSRMTEYKAVKTEYLRIVKEEGGGRLAHQADPLTVAETNFLWQHGWSSVFHPKGLQVVLFFHLVTTFNCRIGKELRNIRLGDLRYIGAPDGRVVYIAYVPRKTKKDDGSRDPTMASNCFKQPVSVCREEELEGLDKKFDLKYVLTHLRRQLYMIEWEGDRDEMPLFWQTRKIEKPSDRFFTNTQLGEDSFNELLRVVINHTGLDTGQRKICNQSMRTSTVNIQEAVGLDDASMQKINGHINPRTAKIYNRSNAQKMALLGAKIQGMATGLPVQTLPDFNRVRLVDGTMVTPTRRILTTSAENPGLAKVQRRDSADLQIPGLHDVTAVNQDDAQRFGQSCHLEGGRVELPQPESGPSGQSCHLEGGRVELPQPKSGPSGGKKRKMKLPGSLTVSKRIKQTQSVDWSEDDDDAYEPAASSNTLFSPPQVPRPSRAKKQPATFASLCPDHESDYEE